MAERRGVLVGDAAAQLTVKSHGGTAQPHERLFAGPGQRHDVDAPVSRVPLPRDQAARLHGVEMMRQRRLPDAHRLGERTLIGQAARLQVQQHKPDRQRSARGGECLVKGAANGTGDLCQPEADRSRRWSHATKTSMTH